MKTGEPVESLSLLTKIVLLMRKFSNSQRHSYTIIYKTKDNHKAKMQCTSNRDAIATIQ